MMTADGPDQVADPCQRGDNGIGNAPGHKKVEGADAIGEGRKEKAKETVGETEHRSRQHTRQKQASRMAQKPENRYQGQDHQEAPPATFRSKANRSRKGTRLARNSQTTNTPDIPTPV